jgi:hypothetical protein
MTAFVYSSTKLEKRTEHVLPGDDGDEGEGRLQGILGRNDPNNVCAYE